MFKSKLEVDKHVDNCLKRINNDTERNLKSFSFAKLYFSVGEYEQARRYVSSYLNVKPKSADGYQLLGKCLEKLNKKDAAWEAYRNSLQIDQKQHNLVIKVCELLSSEDMDIDQSSARYFCDLAQSFDPNNTAVCRLKERLITKQSNEPLEVSELLLKELENRPTDVNLRVRLLKHFLQYNMVKEAYEHVASIEEKDLPIFHNSLSWYETFSEVLFRYQQDVCLSTHANWNFWLLYVSVLDKIVTLSLDEQIDNVKSNSENVSSVFNFDQILTKAAQNLNDCTDHQLISIFLSHYCGQLNFHFATLAYKQAKQDILSFKEVANITVPLLLIAYHTQPPDLHSMWYIHTSKNNKRLVERWNKESSYRCSQAGHILLEAGKNHKTIIMEKANQYSTGMWREQLFKKLFVKRDHHINISTSYFVCNPQFIEPLFKLPSPQDVFKHDEIAQLMYPDSLHHYIWIAMNNKLSDMVPKAFEGLQYSVKNFNNCAAESLSYLDVQAFLICATLCAKSSFHDKMNSLYYNGKKPKLLPASLTENLGTINQSKFLKVAYKMFNNDFGSNFGEIRLVLIKGIEVIRCVGHHGLDVRLLVKLAEIFEERGKQLTKQSEIEQNTARSELYWKTALPLLDKIRNNQLITYPSSRLFEYRSNEMTIYEAALCFEKGKLFIAIQLMKKKDYEKALHIFEQLKDPYSSFYQSQIYKHMADQKTNASKENVTSEMRSQNIIFLSKARDCLYLTLDRLKDPLVDRSHPLNSQLGSEIEKMERLLSRIDSDYTNRNECDGMSDENPSSENSVGDQYLSTYTHTSFQNGHQFTPKHETQNHSTPLRLTINRQEARPSPERLDAQIRQITASRDTAFSNIMDQNRMIVESHRALLDELKRFKDAVNNLTSMVEELKSIKTGFEQIKNIEKSMEELKNSFDVSNLIDSIKEMKKELTELKREQNKNNQLSDEDLHFLDPDYAVDYNINSNLCYNQGIPNMYPTYQPGRMTNPNPLTAYPGLYPGLYPGFYGPLALPQAGAVPCPNDQQNLSTSATVSYAQPSLPTGLPTPSIAVNMLTGQSLSHSISSPKVLQVNNPNIIQNSSNLMGSGSSVTVSTSRAPPINVVITSSDPLPINVPTSQPILSVTIPPQHIKNNIAKSQPHNYQITLPSTSISQTTASPSVLSKPPPTVTTQSILSNIARPIFSAISPNRDASRNLNLIKGDQTENNLDVTHNSEQNNKTNISTSSIEEHDPCPDFKPIIPLPNEVVVNTGEEGETELFCDNAKLYRHVNIYGTREWKERGVGILKILHNSESGKVRILMRRDQVHKICANHFITEKMNLTPMTKTDMAYMWVAHDFADEVVALETFCVRFKTPEQAKSFYEAFMQSKELLKSDETGSISSAKIVPKGQTEMNSTKTGLLETSNSGTQQTYHEKSSSSQPATFGGFVFTSTPTFKPKESTLDAVVTETQKVQKSSPFVNFSFGKSNTSLKTAVSSSEAPIFSPMVITQGTLNVKHNDDSCAEEFVPTAEFTPVIALPDLVDLKTGEEDLEILFENRCKLFRYNGDLKEWKERGVGNIKILKGEDIRIVMRRDQVHKVCCNHTVLKNMTFSLKDSIGKAVVWTAQDFSEGELKCEMFTARFKTEEEASQFLKVLQTLQTSMDENSKVIHNKHHKPDTRLKTTGFGDKFKAAKGSWECKNCFIINEGKINFCIACESPRNGTTPKKTEVSGSVFSFGNFGNKSENIVSSVGGSVEPKHITSSWGSAFKPAEGSWECKTCYIRNSSDKLKCISCETLRRLEIDKELSSQFSSTIEPPEQKFIFGIKQTQPGEGKSNNLLTFGDTFKPKVGSWECGVCLIRNESDITSCISCENPRNGSSHKKEAAKGINLDTPGLKFNFGMPIMTTQFPSSTSSPTAKYSSTSIGTASSPDSNFNKSKQSLISHEAKFIFGSPQKHEFEFKPKSPRRISSGQGDEESDGNYTEEEDDNIYFKPVIPLPDKIDVKTGEEEEDVLYCHRAKLFRFINGEWKERGIGDVKILKTKDSGKLRVVMRREQVLKICLNHILTNTTKYIKKDDKSWLFHAADYSEGEIVHEQFCLRFKFPEVAEEFKSAVDAALKAETDSIQTEKPINENLTDDVEVISETKVTAEEEKEALALGLPPKFFSYRQLPDCTCDQCKKDDEYLKSLFEDDKKLPNTNQNKTSVTTDFIFGRSSNILGKPPLQTQINQKVEESNSGSNSFVTPSTTFSFTIQKDTKSESLREMLMKPPKLSIGKNDNKEQMNSNENTKVNTIENNQKPFSFGNSISQSIPKISRVGNIFGNSANMIFGSTSSPGQNLFAKTNNSSENPSTGSPFSNKVGSNGISTSNESIFNTAIGPSNTSIFGGSGLHNFNLNKSNTLSLFANNSTANKEVCDNNALSIGVKSEPVSDNSKTFGTKSSETNRVEFCDNVTKDVCSQLTTTDLKEDDEVVLKCSSEISFASLAATTTDDAKPAFTKIGDSSFSFLGAGAPVFASVTKDNKEKTDKVNKSKNESDDETGDNSEGYDPHYEPIVPLPDAIVLTTGEEDETPLFNERAKLFRYDTDNKEWKERGVGQLKILHHSKNNTYRLLLRREQVHKVVLNQLIIPNLQLQPMFSSDKAWVWAGFNYTDDGSELEKLAVRFRSSDMALKFHEIFQDCIEKVTYIHNSTVQNDGLEDVSSDEHNTLDETNNEDYDDEEDEDDRSIMLIKRCVLSDQLPDGSWNVITEGDLQVYYDPELYAARISVNDDGGNILSNTLIGVNTVMNIEKNECTWKAVECADGSTRWRTLKAAFSSEEDAEELHANYLESLNYAHQVGIVDEIPTEPYTETE